MRVITAAEFERMTPAERHESFTASIVRDLDQLRARLDRTAQRVLARETARHKADPRNGTIAARLSSSLDKAAAITAVTTASTIDDLETT